MFKNLIGQVERKRLMERASWYEMEAIRAYDIDQNLKGDLFMFMADEARAQAKATKYSKLMDRADELNTLAIKSTGRKADRLMKKAYGLREKALHLSIGEALA